MKQMCNRCATEVHTAHYLVCWLVLVVWSNRGATCSEKTFVTGDTYGNDVVVTWTPATAAPTAAPQFSGDGTTSAGEYLVSSVVAIAFGVCATLL